MCGKHSQHRLQMLGVSNSPHVAPWRSQRGQRAGALTRPSWQGGFALKTPPRSAIYTPSAIPSTNSSSLPLLPSVFSPAQAFAASAHHPTPLISSRTAGMKLHTVLMLLAAAAAVACRPMPMPSARRILELSPDQAQAMCDDSAHDQ